MELPRTDHVGKHFGGASLVTLRRGSGISAGTDVRLNCEGYDSDRGSDVDALVKNGSAIDETRPPPHDIGVHRG